jgi:hypothetical protein
MKNFNENLLPRREEFKCFANFKNHADKNLFAHQAVNCSHGFKNIRYKKRNFINYFNKPSFDQSNISFPRRQEVTLSKMF